jgi:hypothetical protein
MATKSARLRAAGQSAAEKKNEMRKDRCFMPGTTLPQNFTGPNLLCLLLSTRLNNIQVKGDHGSIARDENVNKI